MKAEALKRIDKERDIHLQAFINQVAKSTKEVGKKTKLVYSKFEDLYDHKKRERQILGQTEPENTNFINLVAEANSL